MDTQTTETQDTSQEDTEQDFAVIRPQSVRRKRIIYVLAILGIISVVLLLIARSWLQKQIDPSGPPGDEVAVQIPLNSTPGDIAARLYQNGVIPNQSFFRIWSTYRSYEQFQAGSYTFRRDMSVDEALDVFRAGPAAQDVVDVTIVEGKWLSEIGPQLAQALPQVTEASFEEALKSTELTAAYRPEGNDSWEGLLFPDTYQLDKSSTAEDVIKKLHERFVEVAKENGYSSGRPETAFDLTAYEVLVIASLVESEAQLDEDRARISRVIHNRLADNVWLDIDATLLYSAQRRGNSGFNFIAAQEDGTDPYNTSVKGGTATLGNLPPTPIGAIGAKSLAAALNPAPGDWMFYNKKDNDGSHYFSLTIEEHNREVARARAAGIEGY